MRSQHMVVACLLVGACAKDQGEEVARKYLGHLAYGISQAALVRDLLIGVDPAETDVAKIYQAVATQARLVPAGCGVFTPDSLEGRDGGVATAALVLDLNSCSDGAGIVGYYAQTSAKLVAKPSGSQVRLDFLSRDAYELSDYRGPESIGPLPGVLNYQQLPSGERQVVYPVLVTPSTALQWSPGNDCLTLDQDIQVLLYSGGVGSTTYRLIADNLAVCPGTCVGEGQTLRIEYVNYQDYTSEAKLWTAELSFGPGHQVRWQVGEESGSFFMNVCDTAFVATTPPYRQAR